jgi:hypothetical protein
VRRPRGGSASTPAKRRVEAGGRPLAHAVIDAVANGL